MNHPGEWRARLLLVVAGVAAIVGLVATGCQPSPESQCATNCGARGYRYDQGDSFRARPAACACGESTAAVDGGAGR